MSSTSARNVDRRFVIDLSLRMVIDRLTSAVDRAHSSKGDPNTSKQSWEDAQENVCIEARSAFTTYLGVMEWRGSPDAIATEFLREELARALDVLDPTLPYLNAVKEKLEALERYVEERQVGAH